MRALTVRQPWAGAIIWRGKDVENRTRNIAGAYRGPVAIHVSLRHDYSAVEAHDAVCGGIDQHSIYGYGAFIGVVDLVDVHEAAPFDCGSEWAEFEFGRRTVHLVLANPRPLPEPIPCKGRLGLWTPPAEILEQLQAVL